MENIGMIDNQELSASQMQALHEEKIHAAQKFEAFINSLADIVAKYGNEVLAEIEGAA